MECERRSQALNKLVKLYITDKSGQQFWRTTVADAYSQGERNNMAHRLDHIKRGDRLYAFVDRDSARVVVEEVTKWGSELT